MDANLNSANSLLSEKYSVVTSAEGGCFLKTKTRNEKSSYYYHSPLRRNHPGAIQPSTTCLVGSLQAPNACLLLCLSRSISLIFFVCILREGGLRARPWVSRRGASFQHALVPGPPKPACLAETRRVTPNGSSSSSSGRWWGRGGSRRCSGRRSGGGSGGGTEADRVCRAEARRLGSAHEFRHFH